MFPKPHLDRIAFLNVGGIGDEILFSPVLQAVRTACPDAHLTLILEPRSQAVQTLLPMLDETIGIPVQGVPRPRLFVDLLSHLRRGRYDAVIASGSSPFIALLLTLSGIPIRIGYDTGALSRYCLSEAAPLDKTLYAGAMYARLAEAFLAFMGQPQSVSPLPQISIPESALEKARQHLMALEPDAPPSPRILIHPGVSHVSVSKNILKAWPLEHWQALMTQLLRQYPQTVIYLAGGPDDAAILQALEAHRQTFFPSDQARVISLAGQTRSLMELAAIMAVCDLVISVDSAPMHMAIGLKTPVVALFAPTDETKLVPESPLVQVAARSDLACRPCLWAVRQSSCDAPVCLEIPVSHVLEKIQALIPETFAMEKRL